MKSLRIIQTLFKIARIIALIIFILSIIGAAGCFIGAIVLSAIQDLVVYQDKTVAQLFIENGNDIHVAITSTIVGLIGCGVSIFLAKYSELFFLKELKEGTPFKAEIAKEMRKYGIVYIVTSVAATIVMSITYGVIAIFVPTLRNYDFSFHIGSIAFGLFMIILSVFCDYGAELQETKQNELSEESKEEKVEE